METIYILIPLLCLAASIVAGVTGHLIGKVWTHRVTIGAVGLALILSLLVAVDVFRGNVFQGSVYTWAISGGVSFEIGFLIDRLTVVMMSVVTFVSLMVHIYTVGYMHDDPGYTRFFSYISLFTFAMLMLVMANNFLQLFFGWEAVGLVSYLLIGFWHERESAIAANMKAFLVNRVGDLGFILGIAAVLYLFGSLDYATVFTGAQNYNGDPVIGPLGFKWEWMTVICLLLFVGAMGKSAQVPLHVWLPDSMEGPTPISALIHAATMVTAGVFLVVRCSPIFEYSQIALNTICIVGMTTAFFAATVALVQNDIKKIIAYSTCSQLGYMFFAAGIGAYNVAIFHLFTHAFFKALLFLGAGSVIHSFNNEQDIRKMGGIWRKLPYSWILMLIGTLALTGFPFFSGFYSKEAIIEFAYLKGSTLGYYIVFIGIFTALLTAIYSWRLVFKTFHGTYENKELKIDSIHESSYVMLIPLIVLAIGSIFAGFFFKDLFIGLHASNNFWSDSIKFLSPISVDHPPLWIVYFTPAIVILAIPFAYYIFVKNKNVTNWLVNENKPLYNFLINKWYIDELYEYLFVKTFKKIGIFFWKNIDLKTIDRFGPDGISNLIKKLSIRAVKFQSGYIYQYAFIMLLGFSALLTYLIIL